MPDPASATLTTFSIPGMDCPSEERLIRLALDPVPEVLDLRFDLDARELRVRHRGPSVAVLERLTPLGFGARLIESESVDMSEPVSEGAQDVGGEARVLEQVLAINLVMFFVELGLGIIAQSTGLIADSLDMLADAGVYGLSLYAVRRALADQRRAARISGLLQLILALGVLGEVVRRALVGSEPAELVMIGVALLALIANLACVALLSKHRKGGVHLRASWIFTTTDALANLGVIVAGVLVALTDSAVPDLVVGTLVGGLVLFGAVRILRLR